MALIISATDESKLKFSDFQTPDRGQIPTFPQSHAPANGQKKERNRNGFDKRLCRQCPQLSSFPIKKSKKFNNLLHYPSFACQAFFVLFIIWEPKLSDCRDCRRVQGRCCFAIVSYAGRHLTP